MEYFAASGLALVLSALFIKGMRPLALRFGLVDIPGGRHMHVRLVPLIGGLAIFSATLAVSAASGKPDTTDLVLLITCALVVAVGVLDDRFEITPSFRLAAHVLAALILVLGTEYAINSLGTLWPGHDVRLGLLAVPFTVVAAVALINAMNMLDGSDGIAGGVSFIAMLALGVIFLSSGAGSQALIAVACAGSVGGFLLFNAPRLRGRRGLVFMGDAGSTLLGFAISALALAATASPEVHLRPVLVLWLVPLPIFELYSSTFRRLFSGLSPACADRGHFHHRLLKSGMSAKSVFALYMVVSAASVAVALGAMHFDVRDYTMFYLFLGFACVWNLGIGSLTVDRSRANSVLDTMASQTKD